MVVKKVILGRKMTDNKFIVDIFGVLVSIIAIVITLYFQFQDPLTGIIWVFGTLIFIVIYFSISYPINIIFKKISQINYNTNLLKELKKDLNNLKDSLRLREEISDIKAKMNLLIPKTKKGQIDPRWIVIFIIIIWMFFYLRSKGVF